VSQLIDSLIADDYQEARAVVATLFHLALLTNPNVDGNAVKTAEWAIQHTDAHLAALGIVDPDTVSH